MTKWARVNLSEISQVIEVITYDPVGVINEAFLPEFKSCPDEVELGYFYDPQDETFYLPEGYAKSPNFETFGYVPIPEGCTVDENGVIVPPPPPKQLNEVYFRSKLNLSQKILWDNPDTGTTQQKAVINTIKLDFPIIGEESIREILDLLESTGIIGVGSANEIYDSL